MINQTFSEEMKSHLNLHDVDVKAEINKENIKEQKNLVIDVPWMRKLGYEGDLSLNNG